MLAQQVQDFDVFNALDVMENESFLKEPDPSLCVSMSVWEERQRPTA